MTEYDMYDSLLRKELLELHEENKKLKEKIQLWKKRAYKLRQFSPIKIENNQWL